MKKPKPAKPSKLLERLLKITPEDKAKYKKERLERRASLTLAYQLGILIGEEMVRYLPILSCDNIETRGVISVTCAEGDEYRRLQNIWFNSSRVNDGDTEEWKAVRAYDKILEDKYLPVTFERRFNMLNISENDMADFKKGISMAVWDCDFSNYSCDLDTIDVVADEDGYFTKITLKKA